MSWDLALSLVAGHPCTERDDYEARTVIASLSPTVMSRPQEGRSRPCGEELNTLLPAADVDYDSSTSRLVTVVVSSL